MTFKSRMILMDILFILALTSFFACLIRAGYNKSHRGGTTTTSDDELFDPRGHK